MGARASTSIFCNRKIATVKTKIIIGFERKSFFSLCLRKNKLKRNYADVAFISPNIKFLFKIFEKRTAMRVIF